jgi:hypothetical protein
MAAGMGAAMIIPELAKVEFVTSRLGNINALYLIPPILLISTIGCLAGTLLTPPEDEATLLHFYRTTRPWGWWGDIARRAAGENPPTPPNRNFGRDMLNVGLGIVWQLCLTALPVYIVLREWGWIAGVAMALTAITATLKFTWYDQLEPELAAPPR